MEVSAPATPLDVARVKKDFPILERLVHGKRLVYLDSASSAQKPTGGDRRDDPLLRDDARQRPPGRLRDRPGGDEALRGGPGEGGRFIGAGGPEEVVFTKNATEAINLVAYAWGRNNLGPRTWSSRARSSTTPTSSRGCNSGPKRAPNCGSCASATTGCSLSTTSAELLDGAKLLAVTAASNVLGTLPPVRALADAAHAAGALVLGGRRPVRAPHAHFRG